MSNQLQNSPEISRSRIVLAAYLAVMSVLVGILGALGAVPALFSVMMFDAPGATQNPATIALFVAVASFPFVCLGAIAIAWSLFGLKQFALACIAIWLPVINAVLGGIAYYCLQEFYDGRFNG